MTIIKEFTIYHLIFILILINTYFMSKVTIVSIIYAIGIIIGALALDFWSADTSIIKTMSVFIWTIIFIIALFYADKNEKK